MPNLSYQITVDDSPAVAASKRVEGAFDKIEQTGKRAAAATATGFASLTAAIALAARTAESGFASAGHAATSFASLLVKTSEAAVAVAGSVALVTGAIGHYAAAAGTAGSTTDTLVNGYRALRLALSPTVFTAASIGMGILVEETLRLVSARGKLIEQQALSAATHGISIESVQQLGSAARISGAKTDDILEAYKALQKSIATSGGKSALDSLGIPSYAQGTASPVLLAQIAQSFADIPDPVKRAQAAVDLFDSELAGKLLPQLNQQFADSSGAVERWGLSLSETSRNQIFQFRRDMQGLKDDVLSLGTSFQALIDSAKTGIAIAGAKAYAAGKSALSAIGATLGGAQADYRRAAYGSGQDTTPYLSLLFGGKGTAPAELDQIAQAKLAHLTEDANADVQLSNADGLRKDARTILAQVLGGRESLQSQLSAQRSRQNTAAEALLANNGNGATAGTLTPEQVLLNSSALIGSTQEANDLQARLRGIEIAKKQVEGLRNSGDLLVRSYIDPSAGRNLFGEIQKATSFVDEDGELREFRLLDETRRNLVAAFHVYTRDLQRKDATTEVKDLEEAYRSKRAYDNQLFEKRQEYIRQTGELELATTEKVYAHATTLAGYARDERLQSLQLADPQTVRAKLSAVSQRRDIETDYLKTAAVNANSAIERQKDRDLSEATWKFSNGEINSQMYSDRRLQIETAAAQSAQELSDKYDHDILTASRQAAIESTAIVRDAQRTQFDSLKSSAMGVLNQIESRSKGVFAAIGSALKSSVLTAINEIVSSQIAASLFRVINPGASVTFDKTGGSGKLGGILSGLGLGTKPVFSGGVPLQQSTDQNTVSTDRNTAALERNTEARLRERSGGGSQRFGGPPGPLGSLSRLGVTAAAMMALSGGLSPAAVTPSTGGTDVSTAIHYEGQDGFSQLGSTVSAGSGGTIISGGESLGIPSGYGFPSGGLSGGSGGIGNVLGALRGSIFNGGAISLGPGLVGTASGISNSIGGIGGTIAGGLAGFASSPSGGLLGGTLLLSGLQGKSGVGSAIKSTTGGALLGANIGSHLSSLGIAGGALIGAGAGLAADGLKRGGLLGLGEDAAGGAAIGFQLGGPIGGLIGAGVGAAAGFLRLFFKGGRQQVKDQVKQTYGISISDQIADQVQAVAKQSFAGSISVAIRSTQVQELLSLYAQSTGQRFPIQVKPHEFDGAITNGQLYQVPTSLNGASVGFNSLLPTIAGGAISRQLPVGYAGSQSAPASTGQDINVTLQLDGQVLAAQTINTMNTNPRAVAAANNQSQRQNAGRLANQGAILSPTTVFG